MRPHYLPFYAVTVNEHDLSLHVTPSEALSIVEERIYEEPFEESYGIEPVHGIWELIKRFGAFEDYSDAWLEDILPIIMEMIERAKQECDIEHLE